MDPERAARNSPRPSDEEVLARLTARGFRPEDPPWPDYRSEMLFLTRARFGVSLVEAAEANHIPWTQALVAWEHVRERAALLCAGETPPGPARRST